MEEKKLIHYEGKIFLLDGEKLIEAETQQEEQSLRYKYVRNYSNDEICYVIIGNRFFEWNKPNKVARELTVATLCQNSRFTYYYTKGDTNIVFTVKKDGTTFVLGTCFIPICDNLYKIGRYAYQIVDGEVEKLCECGDFDTVGIRVEISAEEEGVSEMLSFEKRGNRWKKVNHWRPGNIIPQKNV